jgi:hypothetical protein
MNEEESLARVENYEELHRNGSMVYAFITYERFTQEIPQHSDGMQGNWCCCFRFWRQRRCTTESKNIRICLKGGWTVNVKIM